MVTSRVQTVSPQLIDAFIARWDGTAQAERANKDMFLAELCEVLGVPRPEPATGGLGPYRFERAVTRHEADGTTSTRYIDLYKRECFVLEAKRGIGPADLMFVADRGPAKQGLLLPGCRLEVVPPETLIAAAPDGVLILPWNLAAEIAAELAPLRAAGTQFWVAVPRISAI